MLLRSLLTILFLGSALMAQTRTVYVPQFAAGGTNPQITTTITIVNLGDSVLDPARVDIESFGVDGVSADLLKRRTLQRDEAVSMVQREIPGRGTAVVESYSADGTLQLGWVELTTDANIAVEVVFSIFGGGGALRTTTSILPTDAIDEATLLVKVDSEDGVVSNLAALNPPSNGEEATLMVDLYDNFGNFMGSGAVGGVAPGSRIAQNWAEIFPILQGANDFVGTAEVTTSVPLVMLPLLSNGVQLSTQDALPARSN